MRTTNNLKKIVIVTGGSKGLGASICKKLAKEKYKVVIVYKSSSVEAKNVYNFCKKYTEALLIKADVSRQKSCYKVINTVKKELGNINILINNAGKTKFVKFSNLNGLTENDFLDIYSSDKIVDINIKSIDYCKFKLNINTETIRSSDLNVSGVKSERLYNLCKKVGATEYISGPFGKYYLDKELFTDVKITIFEPKVDNHYTALTYFDNRGDG